MTHPLLKRQLRKAFGELGPPAELDSLLSQINEAYRSNDEDRLLLERAMDLTGTELVERNSELAARIEDLEEAQERLRESDRWRRRFLNAAAHELGTPLTPIRLQLHSMQQNQDPARMSASLNMLERNVDRLTDLVRDLLDSAKLQSEQLTIRPVPMDLVAAVQASLDSMRPLAEAAGVSCSLEAPDFLEVQGDPGRIGQALDNLLGNAIKFGRPAGSVRVAVQEDEGGVVHVADDGVGIDPADLGSLFQPFTQLHVDHGFEAVGAGLGLYISRGIAEACGGSIEATSPGLGKGATFSLRLGRPETS